MLIGSKSSSYNLLETELAHAVNIMMAQVKRMYIFDDQSKKIFFFFITQFSVFLSSYGNTCGSLGEKLLVLTQD